MPSSCFRALHASPATNLRGKPCLLCKPMTTQLESHAGTSGRATSNVPQLTPGIGYEFKVAQSVTFCYGDLCPKTN